MGGLAAQRWGECAGRGRAQIPPVGQLRSDFASRDDAILWITENQLGRRNLSDFQRVELALKREPILRARAKANQQGGQGGVLLPQISAEAKPLETRQEVAKITNVSRPSTCSLGKVIRVRRERSIGIRGGRRMTNTQQIFEEIVAGGLPRIRAFVSDQQEEHLYLDFKKASEGHGPASSDDRAHLAEALSGFANSDGGVIVWGIECKSVQKGDPDVASALRPIGNLMTFLADLQKATAEVVAPGVIGVQHISIEDETGQNQGYVVSFIPRSEGEPHMARGKHQHRFYYRSGSSFLKMEPYMLADRYGRRPHPKLQIACWGNRDTFLSNVNIDIRLRLKIGIRNTGLGLALHPALEVKKDSTFRYSTTGINGMGLHTLLLTNTETEDFLAGGPSGQSVVVYPGRTLWVGRWGSAVSGLEVHNLKPELSYAAYCDGFSVHGKLKINFEAFFYATGERAEIELDLLEHGCVEDDVERRSGE